MRERWIAWVSVGVALETEWVSSPVAISFCGRPLRLLPGGNWPGYPESTEFLPSVASPFAALDAFPPVAIPGESTTEGELLEEDEAIALLHSYVSCLAWEQSRAIRVEAIEFNGLPVACIRPSCGPRVWEFGMETGLAPTSEQARALAAFRQGISSELPIDSVVHYFRVLELASGSQNRSLKPWLGLALEQLADPEARGIVELWKSSRRNLADFLVENVRNPVFHSKKPPRIDSDSQRDMERLLSVLPVLKALASNAIEVELKLRRLRA